jgi:hypothetical protein
MVGLGREGTKDSAVRIISPAGKEFFSGKRREDGRPKSHAFIGCDFEL